MPVVVVGTEKNFAALRSRLFAGRVSNKVAGEVAEAMRAANPHANLDRLTPGTVLTVPDAAEVRVRGELSLDETTTQAIEGLAASGKAMLDDVAAAAARREEAEREERGRALQALDALGTAPRERGLKEDLEAARKALAEAEQGAEERAATLERARAEWSAGLDALRQLAGR